jgi:osmotically-inducible protein OsmY
VGNYYPVGLTYDVGTSNRKDYSMSKFERRNRTQSDYRYQDDETDRTFRSKGNRDYNIDDEMTNRRGGYSSGYGYGRQTGSSQMDGDYESDYEGGQAGGFGYNEDEDPRYRGGQDEMSKRSDYTLRSGQGMKYRQGRGSDYGAPYQGGRAGGHDTSYRRGQGQYRGQGSYGGSQYQGESDYDSQRNYEYEGPYVGHGPEGYQRSDERIQEEVSERLMWHGGIDARKIRVSVDKGEVTLKGTVEDRWQKRLAVDAAYEARGVKDVHNELRIHTSSGTEGQEYTDSSATKGQGQGSSQNPSGTRSSE